ncbi:MAG: SMC family ATPase [Nanoarchaeota archaeon]|nr:SMC family ATPase [Nanoarchaeota archaeon]MBU1030140.1 SMC family ATPase [Nanoarchaeota archaeon]MBU1850755.1 SMC family ATPase [Nanoarchaeota archaeon]
MIINSLKLKNIRSYTDENINFSEGSTLLSGDIGVGKTSILLAIEFALFGIIRGQISGSTLLRHGKNEGFVELEFSITNKKIIIKRNLKRTSKSIVQDSGHIIVGDEKFEGTPIELKSKILELIGYPDELITKSKSYIYRYTVYTAQEEMKHILFEGKDERLDVLRKIFDVDKYQRARDNIQNYMRELRTQRDILQTRIEDLDDKQKEFDEYSEKIILISNDIKTVEEKITQQNKSLFIHKKTLSEFEDGIKKFSELKKQSELKNLVKRNLESQHERLVLEAKRSEHEIQKLSEELKDFNVEKSTLEKENILEFENKINAIRENLLKINSRESEFKTKKIAAEKLIGQINSLDKCPVCKQDVCVNHKQSVCEKEEAKIHLIDEKLLDLSELKQKRLEEKENISIKLKSLQDKEKLFEANKIKINSLREKKSHLETLSKQKIELQENIQKLNSEITLLKEQKDNYANLELSYEKEKGMYEDSNNQLSKFKSEESGLLKEKETIENVQKRISTEIERKIKSKTQLIKVKEARHWLTNFFLKLIYIIEKHIMLQIHQEFNSFFEQWFNLLIEDENLNVSLDEEFSPVINQDGYEAFLENLSGGEKTSVALAYRLSLNRVINDFVGTIKTKDLIILDEPTDGFSTEQLDKLRDVLYELKMKQIIIVSHEPKLESYVDNIIRVHKEEHISRVLS